MNGCSNIYIEALNLKNSMRIKNKMEMESFQTCRSICRVDQFMCENDVESISPSLVQSCERMTVLAESQAPLIEVLCDFLKDVVEQNDHQSAPESPFVGSQARFTAAYYIRRIARYTGASPCCLIATLVYLERIQKRSPNLFISSRTLQRLLLIAAMTATKYLEDSSCLNTQWARIGGMSLQELNRLELEFLFALDFDLGVRPEDYWRIVKDLNSYDNQRRCKTLISRSDRETTTLELPRAGTIDSNISFRVLCATPPPAFETAYPQHHTGQIIPAQLATKLANRSPVPQGPSPSTPI